MNRNLFVCAINLFIFISNDQINIEPLEDCLTFIKYYYHEKKINDKNALHLYKEKKWYNLLPKPGLGYDFISGRPMITLAAPDFIAYSNRKRDLQYRILKSDQTSEEGLHSDTVAFISGYHELETLIQLYHKEAQLIKNDSMLLQLKLEENKRLQATTEEVLKIKYALLEKEYTHQKGIMAILSKASSLEPYLHRNLKVIIRE